MFQYLIVFCLLLASLLSAPLVVSFKESDCEVHSRGLSVSSQRLKCVHVNLVERTNVPGEREFLFVPYSVFEVVFIP